MGKVGRVDGGPLPQGIPDEVNIRSSAEKPGDVKSTDIPAEAEKRLPQSLAKEGSAKILEGKIQEMLKESLLRTGTDKPQRSQPKSQIDFKLAQVDQKLQVAQGTKEKIAGHLDTVQKEVERIHTEIKSLKTPLDAAGQERKRSLELQVDHLIDQTKVMLAGAGVDVSKDLRGVQSAPLETKLKVLDGFKRHMGDVLHKKDQEIAELRSQRTQLQTEKDQRLNRKQEISANLEQINSKIQSAMETQQKVAAHISGLKPEIQELRKQLKQLREEMEQSKKVPGDRRNPNSQRGQLDQELKMRERQLESRLNRLIDQTGSVLRDAVKELTGVNPHLDTSTVRTASLEAKLKALEGSVRDLSDLVNGTSKSGEVVVSIGGSDFTAQGLKDYVAKLQNLQKQLRSEQRKLEE